jgi:hypothetical protein
MNNYNIVLFKNKKKRKIIKSYKTEKKALDKFNEIIKENNKIVFDKKIENAEEVSYELGLLTNQTKVQKTLFLKDDIGRNNTVNLEDPEYVFLEIKKYKIEETIFDWQTQTKITLDELVKKYCSTKELKNIFTLNNKLCIQVDSDVSMFSLKDKNESERLLYTLEDYFRQISKSDSIFVRDVSIAQRKWVYNILEQKGFDKKRLYRLKTTFSKR